MISVSLPVAGGGETVSPKYKFQSRKKANQKCKRFLLNSKNEVRKCGAIKARSHRQKDRYTVTEHFIGKTILILGRASVLLALFHQCGACAGFMHFDGKRWHQHSTTNMLAPNLEPTMSVAILAQEMC